MLFFYQQNSKEEDFKCFRGKIDAKMGRKSLEEKLEELESPLSAQDRPSALLLSLQHTLSTKKAHEEAQRHA